MTRREYIRLWLVKASHDLRITRQGMDRTAEEWVTDMLAFHALQAIEKSLKAYLILLEEEPARTHSLEVLLDTIHDKDPTFPRYDFGRLTDYAVQHRYPDDLTEPSTVETEQFIDLAEQVYECVMVRVE